LKERVKAVVLGILVLASLVLSYLLWFGAPTYEFSKPITSERIQFSSSRSLLEMVTPDRVIYTPEEGLYHIFRPGEDLYQVASNALRVTLQEVEGLQPASKEEGLEAWQGPGLCLEYQYPFPWQASAGGESPPLKVKAFRLLWEGEAAWLVTVEGDYYKMDLPGSRLDLLKRILEAQGLMAYRKADLDDIPAGMNVTFRRDIYFPLEELSLPVLQWEREKLDYERLLKVFFIDMSLVRRIEEKDGAVIYTDGQKGVRIYSGGAVEYTMAGGRGRLLAGERALAMAGEIIALYGGWSSSLHLWVPPGFELPGARQKLFFLPYVEGKPLISPEGGVSLSVTEMGAQTYFRQLLAPTTEALSAGTTISASLALERALEYVAEERGVQTKLEITGFYPGYYHRHPLSEQKQILPAWFLEVDRIGLVVIHAGNGIPLALDRF
jgi:regulatory protein YycH of two-component signal transduction system YycFG